MSFAAGKSGVHYLVQAALTIGWKKWFIGDHTNGLKNFKRCFTSVSDATLTEWWNALTERKATDPHGEEVLQIRVHGSPGVPRFPGLVVLPADMHASEWPQGTRHKIGGETCEPMISDMGVVIECRALDPGSAWALSVVVEAIMANVRRQLISLAHATECRWQGTSPPTPDEAMLQEAVYGAVSVMTVRYEFGTQYSFPSFGDDPLPIDWVAQREDLPIDDAGNFGGIRPVGAPLPPQSAQFLMPLTTGWHTEYDGYGSVVYGEDRILLVPKVSTNPSETHAALALTDEIQPKDFRLTIVAETTEQLRTGSAPNPWEAFWVFFNYLPTTAGKNTNYFVLKTNGAELGKATGATDQQFLSTVTLPSTTAVGTVNVFEVTKQGTHVVVKVNDAVLIDFTGPVFDVPGHIGLYTEDAIVRIKSVDLQPL